MAKSNGPVIDMRPDGTFIEPPKPSLGVILVRLALFGVALCAVAVLFWTVVFVVPVLLVLGAAGYIFMQLMFRL